MFLGQLTAGTGGAGKPQLSLVKKAVQLLRLTGVSSARCVRSMVLSLENCSFICTGNPAQLPEDTRMCSQLKALALLILRIFAQSFLPSLLAIAASCSLCLLASMAGQAEEAERRSLDFTRQLPGLMGVSALCLGFAWPHRSFKIHDRFRAFSSEAIIVLEIPSLYL